MSYMFEINNNQNKNLTHSLYDSAMTTRTVLTPVQLRNRHFVTEDGGVDVYRAYPPVIVLESLKTI